MAWSLWIWDKRGHREFLKPWQLWHRVESPWMKYWQILEAPIGMLAAGDSLEAILSGYPWLEREDIQACLVYARRVIARERIEPPVIESDD